MKKLILAGLLLVNGIGLAQESSSIAERLNLLEKKSDKFNVYFNFQSSFDVFLKENEDAEAGFKARQLRLEMRGNINEHLFYRFRHRLNKSNTAQSLDNLAKATDMMYVGYRFNDKFTTIFGKQCQAWGGMEFDINPMNIYEYSDFIENMDNFMLGISFIYKPVKEQEFQFQITDARNSKFLDTYGTLPNVETSKSPLTYILNWNGSMWGGKFQTRWAYGIETEAKKHYSYMLTLGNKIALDKFQLAFDYMCASQDLDRLGYASQTIQSYLSSSDRYLYNTFYNTYIVKAEFQPTEQWNIFAKGIYETAGSADTRLHKEIKDLYTSYGYFAGLEYLPFKDQDLRIFLMYVGRNYKFSSNPTVAAVIPDDYNTNRISAGIMYRVKAF